MVKSHLSDRLSARPVVLLPFRVCEGRVTVRAAMDVAKSIKDKERSGAARVIIIDEGQNDVPEFWAALGGKGVVAPATDGGDDQTVEKAVWGAVKLYKICYEDPKTPFDKLELEEIASGRSLVKEMLDPNDCYILDCATEVYPWTGRNAPMAIKNGTIKLATHILGQRDCWTAPLIREFPGSESVLFKERFSNWGSGPPIQMQATPVGLNVASAKKQEAIDVLTLHRPGRVGEEVLVDDGSSGKISIWRVEDFKKVEVPREQHGEFYSGESYLILYTYVFKNKDCYLIYFWQGRNSSINEKGASALLTIELDEQLKANVSGSAKEVRVVQNKEPHHFMLVFKRKFVVHLGKDPLGKDKESRSGNRLYQVQATNAWNVRALEVQPFAYVLNSQAVFVVNTEKSGIHIWNGKASSPEEQEYAKSNFASAGSVKAIQEGSETQEFWSLFETKKQQYPQANLKQRHLARLWVCSIGTGVFKVEEIFNFCQDDLLAEDVFMLDAYDDIYVWIGKLADDKEKSMSYELAVDFARKAPDGRDGSKLATRVWVVLQGHEPLVFTTHFHGWDVSKYSSRQQEFSSGLTSVEKILAEYNRQYSLVELQNKSYPKGLDTARLEQYLSDSEFLEAFGVTKPEFEGWPIWKKQKTKRELLLF
eukprot:TRINITY_DN517_c0_g1_i8.p1 TRINITY_DN517_c0_g1~~TRINITY_DN517_c0_g1_i8.p1  ORF type:complete len:649 (+),score=120.52 TRINITY_DN517_c0_g1_i8:863-2809(+)